MEGRRVDCEEVFFIAFLPSNRLLPGITAPSWSMLMVPSRPVERYVECA